MRDNPFLLSEGIMKRLTASIAACSLLLLTACNNQTSITDQGSWQPAVGSSGCHPVKFTTVLTALSETEFTGTVTGDITGTVHLVFDEFHGFTGVTNVVAGNATWQITGGTIPELIGETFETRLTNRNILLPGTSLVKNLGSLRALSGVAKANVTYVGETPLSTLQTRLDFTGVICP
jgi:hypothetical protein